MDWRESVMEVVNMARVLLRFACWVLRARPRQSWGRVDVGDINIFFRRYGSAGEPVLLLHGGFMFAESWGGQIKALYPDHTVFAIDTRGHGRTTLGTAPFTYRQLASDAAGFIEQMGVGPMHVIGWSDGGTTALGLALERPDLVRSLVLLGTDFNISNFDAHALLEIDDFLKPLSSGMLLSRLLRRILTPQPALEGEFLRSMRLMWTTLPDFTIEELGRITAPALVIACDRDEFLSPKGDPFSVFEELAAALPHSSIVKVMGGKHTVHIDRAPLVNRLILDFLETVDGEEGDADAPPAGWKLHTP